MTKLNDNQKMLIFIAVIIGIIFVNNAGFFGINLATSDIQFYNKDIILPFAVTNFTSPVIEAYFNDIQLYEVLTYQENVSYTNSTNNETYYVTEDRTINQSIGYTKSFNNSNYVITLKNIEGTGLIKIKVSEGNYSEVKTIEVRQAYVDIKDNIPNLVDKSKLWTIEIETRNPQGDDLEADTVEIDVISPSNEETNIVLEKSGNKFTKQFSYTDAGNYQFKIHARKEGYITKEVTRITSVTKSEGIHPIVYIVAFAAGLWILLFLVKLIIRSRRK
jgi:hypothetical protein